jgi:4'-phosphopantetheinyl transferase
VNKFDYKIEPGVPHFLRDDELHVWRIDLGIVGSSQNDNALSADEQERAGTYRRPEDAGRYVAARTGLRRVLGLYLDVRPEDVRFVYNEYGKPELDRKFHGDAFHFNLSRSGNITIIAVSDNSSVGVDVEFIDPDFPFLSVAEKYFPLPTVKRLRQLPSDLARSMFFEVWTTIEAYGKGKGAGLSDSMRLDHANRRTTQIANCGAGQLSPSKDWSVRKIFAGHDYAAAVATKHPVSCCRYWKVLPGRRATEQSLASVTANFRGKY